MVDENHVDPLPALIASIDQAIAVAPQIARTLKGHFDACGTEGFTEKQALYLAVAVTLGTPGTAP